MKARWLGWAGVEIEADGVAVVIDPLADSGATFAPQEHHDPPTLDGLAGRRLHALDEDLDLGGEHGHLDRLGDVFVGALGVAGQDVVGLLACGQHHDRHACGAVIGA